MKELNLYQELGKYIYTSDTVIFNKILKIHNQWNFNVDLTDGHLLFRAQETVGAIVSIPLGLITIILTFTAFCLYKKYK